MRKILKYVYKNMLPLELKGKLDVFPSFRKRELAEDLFRLRLRKSTGQIDNPMRVRRVRRDIARINTIQNEKTSSATEGR